jgi:Helix-turn-helix domain
VIREREGVEKLNYETIQKYQSFQTIEEMDQSVRGFLYKHKAELSEGTLSVLHFIWKHSVKVIGVSFAKYDYIAEQVKVSRRTVIRAVGTLEKKGMIKKIPTIRMNGKQGVNLLVIQAFETIDSLKNKMSLQDDTLSVTANKTENKQSSLCEIEFEPTYVKVTPKLAGNELDSSFLPESIPEEFIEVAKPFFQAIDIYRLWNRVRIAYSKLTMKRTMNDLIEQIIHAFKQTVFAHKMGRIHTTCEGYFDRIVQKNLSQEWLRENKHKYFDYISGEYFK